MNTGLEIFVDVRTDEEWSAGHLNNALHFELARMEQGQMPDLPKGASIAVYCRRGIRAEQALQILKKNGFTGVRNAGGYDSLKDQ